MNNLIISIYDGGWCWSIKEANRDMESDFLDSDLADRIIDMYKEDVYFEINKLLDFVREYMPHIDGIIICEDGNIQTISTRRKL